MSNFNIGGSSESGLTDGTANIFINSVAVSSLNANSTLKTDNTNKIISSVLEISDVNNLQSELDSTIQNPYVGTIQATDFKSDNVVSYDATVQALVASNATKVSKTDTADQSFVSNLTLTDNTKKISAVNIQTEEITTPNTYLNITGTISQTGNQYYIENTAVPANNFAINMLGESGTVLQGQGGSLFVKANSNDVVIQGNNLEVDCPLKSVDTTQSISPITGSIQTYGGLGVVGNIYNGDGITTDGNLTVGGDLYVVGQYGLVPAATSDYFSYGICSASSVKPTYSAYLAFDQINGTQWNSESNTYLSGTGSYNGSTTTIVDGVSQSGEWVQIAFNGILETDKVVIEGNTKPPLSWVLAGSLDNQTWFTLRDETNYPITGTLVEFTYPTTRTKYVRLIVRSTVVVNYPSVTIDFINIYGKLVVEIKDGKISGEINAGKVNSDYIKTSEISSNLITTTSLLAPNVINKSRFSFTRNTANNSLYLDENIKIRWDGVRDLWLSKISATDIYYATKVVSLGGTLNNGDIVQLITGQLLFYRNIGAGFVSFTISSPSSDLPIYKIHFQLDTAVATEYIHLIVEKC